MSMQVRCRWKRAVLDILQRVKCGDHLSGIVQHSEGNKRSRPRRQNQGDNPSKRRRLRLRQRRPVRRRLPLRHKSNHETNRAVSTRQQCPLPRQHLPFPQLIPQRELPHRIRLFRRRRAVR